jgi:protein-S-isoprenylcysteine O-methyltransferase Ste14
MPPVKQSRNEPVTYSQSPWTGVIGGFAGLGLAMYYALNKVDPQWWGNRLSLVTLLAISVLAIFLLMGLIDQEFLGGFKATAGTRPLYHVRGSLLARSALWRYAAIIIFLTILKTIYLHYVLYQRPFYTPFRTFAQEFYLVFLALGFPYIFLTLRWRANQRAEFKDPGLHLLLWGRTIFRRWVRGPAYSSATVLGNQRSKIVFLGFMVEGFFLPLMTVFLVNQFNDFSGAFQNLWAANTWTFQSDSFYWSTYHGMYMIDVMLAMGGYALPMRWLDNKIRSVEPTFFGWFVALACYPPIDTLLNQYFIYGANETPWALAHRPGLYVVVRILTLALVAVYVGATMMFGTRFSNLTNRGILSRGVYSVVRHPAYASKNISWWLERLPGMGNMWNALPLLGWNMIYILRALTEERHLSKDRAYRAYREKVRYRFIPWVI